MKPKVVLCVYIGILYVSNVSSTGNNRWDELEKRITALYQTVDFMAQRPDQMNLDSVFGLTMVEVHVRQVLNHEYIQYVGPDLVDRLIRILELCQRSHQQTMDVASMRSDHSVTLNRMLNHPDIWTRSITWSSGLLGPRPGPSENNTKEAVLGYFNQGTPDESESDECIVQLANDSTEEYCQVSDRCADMLLKNDHPRGYPLTHRLLYVQIAIALKCSERRSTPFDKLIPAYCKAVLQDAVDIEDANFPSISRDMISEQVLLCGMEGYTEFANDHYASLIIGWSNSAKCYSAFGFVGDEPRRSKRETGRMDYGCDNHATSLAAASLSLLIRHFVETLNRLRDNRDRE